MLEYLGEIFALATAIVWAFAVVFFKKSGETVHPIALNLFKNVLAFLLIIPTAFFFGESLLHPAPTYEYALLLISGMLGIGLADTFFFKSLNLLGASLSAIVDCLYSPSIIALSLLFLDESMSVYQVIGLAMILSAILTTTSTKGRVNRTKRDLLIGLAWGAAAMLTMAVGLVMVKSILENSDLLWVTEIRLLGGILTLIVVLLLSPRRKMIVRSLYHVSSWRYTVTGSFLGAYLSMILWLAGMKYTQASTAAALNQTSNIFIFVFAAMFLKEPINLLRTIAIILAVGGAFIIMFG